MEYRFIGNTGIKISRLCFGTMSFGGDADESLSAEMFRLCRDAGVNFFDCADVYQAGRSEEILGHLIHDCRPEVIITSKSYFPTGPDVNAAGSNRKHLRHSLENSLRRLGTDYLDFYFLHRFDDTTPLEETLSILEDFIREGKVLFAGVSNFTAWQTAKALGISERRGWNRIRSIQPMYNLVKRQAEVEILPLALDEGLGVIPYSPLGGGLLSGKYGKDRRPESGRLIDNKMYVTRYGEDWMFETAERFVDLAREWGFHPVSLAVAWVGGHPAVTAPIIGARNPEQLGPALDSLKIILTDEMRERISGLSPRPPSPTDRNEEGTTFNYGVRE